MGLSKCKRMLAVAVALLVVAVSAQVPVSTHYCGGQAVDTKVFATAEACGPEVAMDGNADAYQAQPCCRDEIQLIDAGFTFVITASAELSSKISLHTAWISKTLQDSPAHVQVQHVYHKSAPPMGLSSIPLRILFSSFQV